MLPIFAAALAAPPAVIAPKARSRVAQMRAFIGDPYATPGLRFTFVVGEMRREHHWDVRGDKVAVRWAREDGVVCTVTTQVGYDGPDETQRKAWSMFVNDQFWLLAPAKVGDAGATVGVTEAGVTVRYEGVGVTPGDVYSYTLKGDTGEVEAWSYTLASGRSGSWEWAPATQIGTLRFVNVAPIPPDLGE
jgi:hypothetical protein